MQYIKGILSDFVKLFYDKNRWKNNNNNCLCANAGIVTLVEIIAKKNIFKLGPACE